MKDDKTTVEPTTKKRGRKPKSDSVKIENTVPQEVVKEEDPQEGTQEAITAILEENSTQVLEDPLKELGEDAGATIAEEMANLKEDVKTFKRGGSIVEAKEMIIMHHNLLGLMEEVVYLGNLGAILEPEHFPRIKAPLPYLVKVLLPVSKRDLYLKTEERPAFVKDKEYNTAFISCVDVLTFMSKVMEHANKGYVIKPGTMVTNIGKYSATLVGVRPSRTEPFVNIMPPIRKYSKEDLDECTIDELQLIGSWYSITGKHKNILMNDILQAQKK